MTIYRTILSINSALAMHSFINNIPIKVTADNWANTISIKVGLSLKQLLNPPHIQSFTGHIRPYFVDQRFSGQIKIK